VPAIHCRLDGQYSDRLPVDDSRHGAPRITLVCLLSDDTPLPLPIEAILLLANMERPELIEVAREVHGSHSQHCFGCVERPTHPTPFEPVSNQILAGSLDDVIKLHLQ
jgi:hypothetical protein